MQEIFFGGFEMKKAIVYIFAALIALNALAGCGMEGDRNNNTTVNPSATPIVTTPDVNNGIVGDRDGIITDDDNGRIGDDKDTHNENNGTNGIGGTNGGSTGANNGTGTGSGANATHTPGTSSASPSPETGSTRNADGAKK